MPPTGDSGPELPSWLTDAGAAAAGAAAAPAQAATPATLRSRRARGSSADAFFRLEMLPAGHGDCLWIEYGAGQKTHRVLVDCGTESTAKRLLARVELVPEAERSLELFVMTHVDADHIGGALPFFKAIQKGLAIDDVWFNGWEQISGTLGPKQGEQFTTAIRDFRLPQNHWQRGGAIVTGSGLLPRHELPGGLKLTLLSPSAVQLRKMGPVWVRELKKAGLEPGSRVEYDDKLLKKGAPTTSEDVDELADAKFTSDGAEANGTSIALLAEYQNVAVLLGADAHVPVLIEGIRKLLQERNAALLRLDAFKLPHHGSQNNLSKQLLDLLDCPRYLVSSNGSHFQHPDRQAIARVVKYGGKKPSLYFNYSTKFNNLWAKPAMKEEHGYAAHYPATGTEGLTVTLLGRESS
jgi:beta-lactamase superfamily II metal-dependent hydrolase